MLMEERYILFRQIKQTYNCTPNKHRNINHQRTFVSIFYFNPHKAKDSFYLTDLKWILSQELLLWSTPDQLVFPWIMLLHPVLMCTVSIDILWKESSKSWLERNLTGQWSLPSAPSLIPQSKDTSLPAVNRINIIHVSSVLTILQNVLYFIQSVGTECPLNPFTPNDL